MNRKDLYIYTVILLTIMVFISFMFEEKINHENKNLTMQRETKSTVITVTVVDCYKVHDYYEVVIRDTYGNDWVYMADEFVPDGTELKAIFTNERVVQVYEVQN